ncbi:MAG: hypothetical protein FWB94_05090 [Chitinispirillia bacterium]|nr:hypothetical protein [Chitinispirillia bacterium]
MCKKAQLKNKNREVKSSVAAKGDNASNVKKNLKYYILVTMESAEPNLVIFTPSEHYRMLKTLVKKLKECVEKVDGAVVWISPDPLGRDEDRYEAPHLRIKRNPTIKDFIDAHNDDEHEVVIFNYGHAYADAARLLFVNEDPFQKKDEFDASAVKTLIPSKNGRNVRSHNYVCYQEQFAKYWKDELPNAKFYFTRRTNESDMAILFLNALADEINKLCPGTHQKKYKYKCTATECVRQLRPDRCKDTSKCEDTNFKEGLTDKPRRGNIFPE